MLDEVIGELERQNIVDGLCVASLPLTRIVTGPKGEFVVRLRCVTPKCRWIGWKDVWHGGACPRCGGLYGVYA
jgi:hypothetical protein